MHLNFNYIYYKNRFLRWLRTVSLGPLQFTVHITFSIDFPIYVTTCYILKYISIHDKALQTIFMDIILSIDYFINLAFDYFATLAL